MAKSYLGKISALVTANTSDFNRKLDESAQRTRSFAASVKSQINAAERAASKSLDGIYTSLQKVERALSAAGGRRLSLIDDREANKIRQLVSAAEEVYRPLERAAKASEKLGADVRANFQPALIAAQKSAESLNRGIESGGTVGERSFQRIRRQVELTAESIDRLSEVQAEVGRLATGRELRFSRPSVAAALEDARASQQRLDARGASGAARVGRMGSGEIVQRQIEAANQIEAAYSRLLAARSEQASNRFRSPGNVAAAEDALDDRVAALNRVTAELNAQQDVLDAQVSRERELADLARARAQAASRFLNVDQRESDLISKTGLATTLDPSGRTVQQRIQAIQQLRDDEQRRRFTAAPSPPDAGGLGLFGSQSGTAEERAIQRAKELDAVYRSLPDSAKAGIGSLANIASSIANQVGQGVTKAENLELVLDRLQNRVTQERSFVPVGDLERSARELKEVEGQVRAVNAAAKFGTPLTDIFETAKIDSFKAKLSVLQQTLIATGSTSGAAGERVAEYAAALERASRTKGGISSAASEIAKVEAAAVKAVAAISGISPGRLAESLRRVGDIGRGSFGNLGLGVQQAVFAFEDFFSVTGGLDQRIRAAGNNISQLGFILGGTQGLIAGVSAAIVGQLVAAYIRWSNAGVGTQDRVKALNDALARQESRVESLAEAFASLADEIGRIGFSRPGSQAAEFNKQLNEIRQKQKDIQTEEAAAVDPEVQRQRGIIAASQSQLENSEDPGERVRLNRRIREARQAERRRLRELEEQPQISGTEAAAAVVRARAQADVGSLPDVAEARQRRLREAEDEASRLLDGPGVSTDEALRRVVELQNQLSEEITQNQTFGFDNANSGNDARRQQIAELEAVRLSLESGGLEAANALEIEVLKAARSAAEEIGRAQSLVAAAIEAGIPGAIGLQAQLDTLTESLQEAQDDLAEAQKRAMESGLGADANAAENAKKEVDRIQEALNARREEIAAIDAARRSFEAFSGVIERVLQAANQTVSAAESNLSNAERDFEIRPSQTTGRSLLQAQSEFNAAQDRRAAVEAEAAQAAERARNDPESQRRQRRIAEIDQELSTTGVLASGQREALIAERERLRDEERRRIDPILEQARRDEQEFSARQESARRGREIGQTPAERAGQDLARNLVDLQNAFDTTIGPQVQGDLVADQQRVINEALRSTAPAIFGLADQVQNAVLQGPSRAALQASDVTTAQGAAELNRLLRGDDSARNQDLVELQKQSNSLEELVRIARESGAPPGVLDL